MTDDRTLTAAMVYYLRDEPRIGGGRRVVAWNPGGSDDIVTAMVPPVDRETGRDVLYLPVVFDPDAVAGSFARREDLPPVQAAPRSGIPRVVRVVRLQDYRGR
jgi:hypothetical protein